MQDFEKLGVFYLGREYDLGAKQLKENLVLYDSRDLVTHAVVVGMTGSGKTGLCIDLIEEAAIDGVPSILIDPKGDLTNLLLTFPQLRGADFQPWVNPDDALRKNLSVEDYAAQQAALWQKGLADWGQDGARIQRLRDAAEFVIYTPGSSAGVPVSILKSFAAPPAEILEDGELLQERVTTTVTGLLGLLNITADPLQSREHILLSTILANLWSHGKHLDLASLISQVQNPPVARIGVLDLETFYPSKDRFGLVMALNNLLASPGFSAWMEGTPLDIGQILHTPQGKPRVAIFSVAHLGDAERMFFVAMLLNQILGWMRADCVDIITEVLGADHVPVKSACFFCPATKLWELFWRAAHQPDLLERALFLERNALTGRHSRFDEVQFGGSWDELVRNADRFPSSNTTVGLGRSFAWNQWARVNGVVDDNFRVKRGEADRARFLIMADRLRRDDNARDARSVA